MTSSSSRRRLLQLSAPIGSLREVAPVGGAVALTYDDGPEPGGTEAVLAALADAGVTATFFVLVRRAEAHPELLAEVVDAGHEIGLHGWDHVRLTTLGATEVFRRTRDARRRLEDRVGRPVRWFRPPYGAQRPSTWAAIRSAGLESAVWSHAAFDWVDDPVETLAERTLGNARAGSVLLMHDGHAGPDDGVDDGPAPTFDRGRLARLVLEGLADRGLRPTSLGAGVAAGRPFKGAWFRD